MTSSPTSGVPVGSSSTPRSVLARLVVLGGSLVAVVGAAWGSGAFGGTPIQEAADGALAADATVVAPATPAFGIWSLIYAGLVAFAVAQALPRASVRTAAVAPWVLASMILNALWIAVVQAGWLWLSVAVIAVLAGVLGVIAARLRSSGQAPWYERVVVDLPVGLYMGWVCVAAIANVAAAGAAGIEGFTAGDGAWAGAVALIAAAVLALALAFGLRASATLAIATGGALAWGLAWIGVGRISGDPANAALGVLALAVSAVALVAPIAGVLRRRGTSPRSAA